MYRYCPANWNCEWGRAGDHLTSRVALYSGGYISIHVTRLLKIS